MRLKLKRTRGFPSPCPTCGRKRFFRTELQAKRAAGKSCGKCSLNFIRIQKQKLKQKLKGNPIIFSQPIIEGLPRGTRYYDCPDYDLCLTWAAIMDWPGFDCTKCQYYKEDKEGEETWQKEQPEKRFFPSPATKPK